MASSAEAGRVVDIGERQYRLFETAARFVDLEGAFRSAKTWTALLKLRIQCEQWPGRAGSPGSGIGWAISQWTEDGLHQKLIPNYRLVCDLAQLPIGEWNTRESCFDHVNGARVYAVHLKTSQISSRFAKVRGLTVAGWYGDQWEEVPEDVSDETALRLSQPGFPQQMIVTPNPVAPSHWINRKWPVDNSRPDHLYLRLSIWDNAHNLSPETIRAAETLYPIGHPARRSKLEGMRGLDVKGTPVYTGAFSRQRHVQAAALNPSLPLCEAYDFGFHHPAVIWGQWAPWGWVRILGGLMGQDMHLDEFLPIVERYRAKWFADAQVIEATCDPSGANAQGVRGTPVAVLRAWYRDHGQGGVVPLYDTNANAPERRRACIDTAATYMRHESNGEPCFLVDPERWALVTRDEIGRIDERYDAFFLDGLELGYVLEEDARHSQRLGSFHVPVKDGWFEHGMNAFEYLLQQFVRDLPVPAAQAPGRHQEYLREVERVAKLNRILALQQAQADPDEDPYDDKLDGTVPAIPERRPTSRSGY